MFKRLFGRGSQSKPPTLDGDMAQDDLELRAARRKAFGGRWAAARDIVLAAGEQWELRGRRMTVLSEAAELGDWFQSWRASAPDDPVAAVIYASMMSDRAGRARGSSSAANTTRTQFANFAQFSAQAAEASQRAITLAPKDPAPWAVLLNSYFAGGSLRQEAFAEALAEGLRRDPYNFDLHVSAVSFYCEKWFGSNEQMFATARAIAADAPPGATAAMMPYLAHFEYAMREYMWDTRTEATREACRRYFQHAAIQSELDAAAAKWRSGGAKSLGRTMTCRHWQAIGYVLGGRRDEARAVLAEIGPYVGSTPAWAYFWSSQAEGYETAWAWAFKA